MKRKTSILSWFVLGSALLLPLGVTAFQPRPEGAGLECFPLPPAPAAATAEAALDAEQNADRLVDAIIQIESNGDPRKVGRHGERGLMQLKSGTWHDMTVRLFG